MPRLATLLRPVNTVRFSHYVRLKALMMIFAFGLLNPQQAYCEYIEQISIQQGSTVERFYIKLLEKDAPLTVQNFRSYVRSGAYSNSFIHRSIPDFIIQGGGFTYDPQLNNGDFSYDAANNLYTGGLQPIAEGATPIVNEFFNSNVRGTLAMAKKGTDPDSATSQWFVNLVDNVSLDTQNGGFTVFAEVLGSGMDVVDRIASKTSQDRSDIHPAFTSIPLLNFTSGYVTEDNLIRVNSIAELLSISPDIDYGTVTIGTNLQPEIVIKNSGDSSVTIGNIDEQNPLLPPFSIVNDFCSNRLLSPGQRCSLIVLFSPESTGYFEDSINIEFPGLGINYYINLSATGGSEATEADISSGFSSIDFGVQDRSVNKSVTPYVRTATIRNTGNAPLSISTITLSPDSDEEFSVNEDVFSSGVNCINISTLEPDEVCKIKVLYLPLQAGSHNATLTTVSSDPDESPFDIPIFAEARPDDTDGIDFSVEDAAPNGGDANNDSVLDSRQSNAASLPDLNGQYMTYVSDLSLNQSFSAVRIINQDVDDENPDNIILSTGVHEFTIDNVALSAVVRVGLLLPVTINPSAYYIYGETNGSSAPQWQKFNFDGETGPVFVGKANIGSNIQRNIVFLNFKNGGRGDTSGALDNKVVVKSGISYINNSSNGSSGFISLFFLQIIVILLIFRRLFSKSRPHQILQNH